MSSDNISNLDPANRPVQPESRINLPVREQETPDEIRTSQALQELSSGVAVREVAIDRAEIERDREQGAALTETIRLQEDNNTINSMDQELSNIQNELRAIEKVATDFSEDGQNIRQRQDEIERSLDNIEESRSQTIESASQLRSVREEDVARITDELQEMGTFEDTERGELNLDDLRRERPASLVNNPELVSRATESATRQIAAVRNTVTNVQGTITRDTGETLERAVKNITDVEQAINNREEVDKTLDDVTGSLRNNPFLALDAAANVNTSNATNLLPGGV